MSKIEVDAIDKQSGSTLTLGGSGTAVTLACGATQTGFGRTGTVNWITTKKTTDFTAANGEGYFVDTAASGAVTMTLPASPSAGNIVGVKDYNGNFGTANLTIARNGSPINGGSGADVTITTNGASIFLVYVDATQGWVATQDDSSTFAGESFMIATGGTITQCGSDKIHTFTGPGSFVVCSVSSTAANNEVSYLVVAGGASGGYDDGGGAGGAGGFRETKSPATPYTASPLDGQPSAPNRITVTATSFPITVGGGGASRTSASAGASGSNSQFSTIIAAGGGGGGTRPGSPDAIAGGSGGGGGGKGPGLQPGGAGNTPPVTPPQGNSGGSGSSNETCQSLGGGGGGAIAVGASIPSPFVIQSSGGAGGSGATTSINGSATAFAGGGGGGGHGTQPSPGGACGGAGGNGGGGAGSGKDNPTGAVAGTVNTGGGGGGGSQINPSGGSQNSGAGGSGIVIIRYKFA